MFYALPDERRDLLLPSLKRVRPPGRESRGRAEGARVRRDNRSRTGGAIRRPERRGARFLQARRQPLSGARRSAWALAALISLAGCGGGDLSHSDFVKRADAVCSAYTSQTTGLSQPPSYTKIVEYVNKTLPLYDAALRKLEALKPPPSDATAVRAWLAADRRVAKAVRDLDDAAQ